MDPLTPAPPPDPWWAAPGAATTEPAPPVAWPPQVAAPAAPATVPRWGSWTPPPDERSITVGGVIGEAWGTYKRAFGPLLVIGAVLGLLAILLSLPTEVYTLRTYEAMFRLVFDAVDSGANNNGVFDPILLQTQLEAILTMPTSTAVTFAVAAGAAAGVGLLGACVLTAAALTARAGRIVSPTAAVMAVLARGSALVVPAVLLGAGTAVVTLAVQLNSQNIQQSDFASAGESTTAQDVLAFAAIGVSLGIFYLSVRWSLAIAAILTEGIGLRAGLRRSSQLTRGHRLRLAAIVIVVALLQGLTVTIPAVVIAFVVGLGVGAVSPGIVAFAIAGIVGSAVWAPVSPAVGAVVYGRLTEATRAASRDVAPAV
jgi:hypothetical protein